MPSTPMLYDAKLTTIRNGRKHSEVVLIRSTSPDEAIRKGTAIFAESALPGARLISCTAVDAGIYTGYVDPKWHSGMKPLRTLPKGQKLDGTWTEVAGGYIYDRRPPQ